MKFPKPIKKKPSRKCVRRMSVRMREKMAIYHKKRMAFLIDRPWCQACAAMGKTPQPSKQIHHKVGRVGFLLLDVRHWLAVCEKCHSTIHLDISKARALDLIGEVGQWNNPNALV